jgi:polyisoprenoid-binding protein YceI
VGRGPSQRHQITGHLDVDSASINTKLKKRDEHLRSDDFFASDQYPTITFQITDGTVTETGVALSGKLTVRDRTLPITFPATVTQLPDGAAAVDAKVSIDRADYGLTYRSRGATKMANVITIRATFIRT